MEDSKNNGHSNEDRSDPTSLDAGIHHELDDNARIAASESHAITESAADIQTSPPEAPSNEDVEMIDGITIDTPEVNATVEAEAEAIDGNTNDTPASYAIVEAGESTEASPSERSREPKIEPVNLTEWRNSIFIQRNSINMTMTDYLKTTTCHGLDSWWEDCHMDFALHTLRSEYCSTADPYIATPREAETFFKIVTGLDNLMDVVDEEPPVEDDGSENAKRLLEKRDRQLLEKLRKKWKDSYDQMIKKTHIILPINNGFGEEARGIHNDHDEPLSGSEDLTARCAVETLSGFEKFMNVPKGRYKPRILLWTPHQTKDNSYRSDEGACGPFVYAFLEYLLNNHLCSEGLKEEFGKGNKHCTRLDFHSLNTRKKLRNKFWEERKAFEADARNNAYVRLNLTETLLKNLDITEEGLENFVGFPFPSGDTASKQVSDGGAPGDDPDEGPESQEETHEQHQDDLTEEEFYKRQVEGSIPEWLSYEEHKEDMAAHRSRSNTHDVNNTTTITTEIPALVPLEGEQPIEVTEEGTINFTHMDRIEVDLWVNSASSTLGGALAKGKSLWEQKTLLQFVFGGGLKQLSRDDVDIWVANHPAFEGIVEVSIEHADVILKGKIQHHIDRLIDRRGRWSLYPEQYRPRKADVNSIAAPHPMHSNAWMNPMDMIQPPTIAEDERNERNPFGRPNDVFYHFTVNFTHVPEREVTRWINQRDRGDKLSPQMDLWEKKARLQRAFGGGFGSMSHDDWKHWKAEHPDLSTEDSEEDAKKKMEEGERLTGGDMRGFWSRNYPQGPWDVSPDEYNEYWEKQEKSG